MTEQRAPQQLVQDITTLYELSLCIGSSLDLIHNIENFSKVLMARKSLNFFGLWLYRNDSLQLTYASPRFLQKQLENTLPTNFLTQRLEKALSFEASDETYSDCLTGDATDAGVITYFKLVDIGLLKITSSRAKQPMSALQLNQLGSLMDKLRVSLLACMEHDSLVGEIEERKRAEEKAEHANASKTRFLANISHEMRTPLNGILAGTELLLNRSISPQLKEILEIVRNSGQLLSRHITNILDLTRIDSNTFQLKNAPFSVVMAFESCVDTVKLQAAKKHLNFDVIMQGDLSVFALGDEVRFKQLIMNLLTNALRFTEKGFVRLVIQLTTADDNVHIHFVLSDSGIGISEDLKARLFTPFFQADDSATKKHDGLGLGLAIIKGLIELMKGEVQLLTTAGEGTCVAVDLRLPVAEHSLHAKLTTPVKSACVILQDPELANSVVQLLTHMGVNQIERWQASTANDSSPLPNAHVIITEHHHPFFVTHHDALANGGRQLVMYTPLGVYEHWIAWANQRPHLHICTLPLNYSKLGEFLSTLSHTVLGDSHDATNAASLSATSMQDSNSEPPAADKPRLLIVEDNPANQIFLKKVLNKLHFDADQVENGQEAVNKALLQNYDVIFMDIQMPIMDGLTATRLIRGADIKQPRIVAVSANAFPDDIQRCHDAGIDLFVGKPFTIKQIASALEESLGKDKYSAA